MSAPRAPRLGPDLVGAAAGPLVQAIDARWLMAYAAALGETDPRYFDTVRAEGPQAHPLFPVCYEWPAALALREAALAEPLRLASVHATHEVAIHRPPRAGDTLSTTARLVGVAPRRSGALVLIRFETVDDRGEPVTTTTHGSLHRGVAAEPAEPAVAQAGGSRRPDGGAVRWEAPVEVAPWAAHVYTECARIWNPIHTDLAVARAAGLPAPILHGTATLALAVSRVVAHDLGGEPSRVRGLSARFTGMVRLPSTLVVRGRAITGSLIAFDAVDAEGHPVLGEGAVTR